MRRALFTTLCTLTVVLFLHPANALAGPAWRSWDAGLREAGTSGRPVLVDVTTDWCGWCKRMDRDVYARADVQSTLARRFVTVKLDAESGDAARYEGRSYTSRTLAARLGVNSYPTTVFLSAKGAQLGSVPGYLPPEDFLLLLRFVGDGHAARGENFADFQRAAGARTGRPPR
jgi:thioredoxin-related protein